MIEKIDQTRLDKIRAKTPESLPINPSTSGMSPQAVRRHFYAGMTDENESVVAELNRIVDEVNEEIETINGNADGLDTRLETAESEIDTLQTDMAGAEADITLLGANIQNLGDTVGAIQEKDSEQDNRLTLSESDIADIEAIINNLQLGIVPREIHNAGDMLESISPSLDYRENDNPDNPTLSERLTSWIVTNLGRQPNETDALMVKDIAEPNKDYVHTYYYWEALGTHEAGWRLADIGHAPPPIEQQRIEFTEASTRANIGTGESTATLFGKIKKWYTDLKPHAFNDLATTLGTEEDKAPTNKLLRDSTCAAFYRSLTEIDSTFTKDTDMITVITAMANNSIASYEVTGSSAVYPDIDLQVHIFKINYNRVTCFAYRKVYNNVQQYFYVGGLAGAVGNAYRWAGWRRVFTSDDISTVMPISSAAASNEKALSEKVVYDEFAKKQDLKYGYIVDSRPTHSNYWGKVAEIDVSSIGAGDVNLDFLVTTNYYNKNQMGILRFAVRKASGVSIVSTNYVDLNWLIKSTTLSESKYVAVIQGLKVSLYARPANQYGGTRFELLQATRTSGEHISDYYTLYEVTNPTDTELPTNDGIVTSSVLGTTAPTPTTDNSTVPKSYVDSGLVLKAPLANPTFTGSVIVPTTPSGPSAAVAKSYADLKVALAGNETITGIKTFATGATPLITDAPTTDLMAVNKLYVDGAISNIQTTIAVINALDNSSTTNALSANMGKTINDKLIASSLQLGQNAQASGSSSTALGRNAQASGSYSTAVGWGATAYGYSTAVGWGATAYGTSSTALGEYTTASGSSSTALGGGANTSESEKYTMRLGDNDHLSALKCKVALTTTSDERDKADITAIPNSLDFIDRLTPITYKSNQRTAYLSDEQKESENYKKYGLADYDKIAHARGTKKGSRQRVGLKAQEIQQALAEVYGTSDYANLVDDNFHDLENKPQDVENQLTVAYSNIIPFLVGAIKELKAEIALLKGEKKG